VAKAIVVGKSSGPKGRAGSSPALGIICKTPNLFLQLKPGYP
jgi:hypothetical protein